MMSCSQQSTMEFLHPYDVSLELIHMLCACLCLSLRCHKSGMLFFISVNMHFYFFNCTYSNTWLAHSVYCTARCLAATRGKRDGHIVVWPRRFPSASSCPSSPACIRTPWRMQSTSEARITENYMKWYETDKRLIKDNHDTVTFRIQFSHHHRPNHHSTFGLPSWLCWDCAEYVSRVIYKLRLNWVEE